jgi:hypothetical protein
MPLAAASLAAMSSAVSPAASARAGSTSTSTSRTSPAVTVMGPTPATRDSAGRTW